MRKWGVVALCAALSGCAFQRAEVAQTAQASMVGMTKEQILCFAWGRQQTGVRREDRGLGL
jgi:hypothetical protein